MYNPGRMRPNGASGYFSTAEARLSSQPARSLDNLFSGLLRGSMGIMGGKALTSVAEDAFSGIVGTILPRLESFIIGKDHLKDEVKTEIMHITQLLRPANPVNPADTGDSRRRAAA